MDKIYIKVTFSLLQLRKNVKSSRFKYHLPAPSNLQNFQYVELKMKVITGNES